MGEHEHISGSNSLLTPAGGEHFCLFFETGQDLLEALVPFFKFGLENNEFCVWVTSDPLTVDDAVAAMRAGMSDFDQYLESGKIEIFPYTDWYMKDGHFDAERVLSGWVAKFEEAMSSGYDGMRVTGNTAWLEHSQWQDFVDYEKAINEAMRDKLAVLCTYSLQACGASEIMDVLENHEFALSKREGSWQALETTENLLARQVIQEREEELRAIYDHAPLIMMLVDEERRVRKMNEYGQRFAGTAAAELLNKRAGEALGCLNSTDDPQGCGFGPHCQQCPVRQGIAETFKTGNSINQVEVSRPLVMDGEAVDVTFLLSTSKLSVRGEPQVLITIQDITERKRAERKISDAELRYRTLFEQSPDGIIIVDPETSLPLEFNDKICLQLGYSREEFANMRIQDYEAQLSPVEIDEVTKTILAKGWDSFETRHRRKDGQLRDMQVLAQVVDLRNRKVLYCICRDITDKKAAEEKLMLTWRLNEALNEINLKLGSTLDFDEIMNEVMSLAAKALHSESAIMATAPGYDDSTANRQAARGSGFVVRYTQGTAGEASVGTVLTAEVAPVAVEVLKTGMTMAVPSTFDDSRFDSGILKSLSIYSSLAAPLSMKTMNVGVIAFRYHTRTKEFTQAEIDFVEKLAAAISMALDNARLYQKEIEARAKIQGFASRLSLLHNIGLTLNRETDKRRLLGTILKGAAELTLAGVGAMILDSKGKTDVVSMYYAPWYDERCTVMSGESMAHQQIDRLAGLRDKDATRINLDASGRSLNLPEGHPGLSGSLLIGAIKDTRGNPVGYFMLSHKAGGSEFSAEDEEIISLLVAQSSVALISAENFEKEHEVAETLQTALLPELPTRRDLELGLVYRSAGGHSRLGGDFYDFIELDDGRIVVAVGDVCGKGLEAASVTAMVKYMLRAYVGDGLTVGECLTQLNRSVARQIAMEKFVTLGVAFLNPADYSLEYASAGHPAPMLFRNGSAKTLAIQQAVPLGVLTDYEFKTTKAIATPDNSLLMYTDGLIDVRLPDGESFGERGILDALAACRNLKAQGQAEDLVESAVNFSGGHLRDDIALVISRFNSA